MVSQTSTLEVVGRGLQAQVVEQPTNVRLGSILLQKSAMAGRGRAGTNFLS